MSKIKTVFMDLDGSTLIDKNIIPDDLRNLIIQRKDINWIIATGRSYPSLIKAPFHEILPANSIHIVEGGARLVTLGGKLFKEFLLKPDELQHFFKIIDTNAIDYIYYCHKIHDGQGWFRNPLIEPKFQLPIRRSTHNFQEFENWTKETTPAKLAFYRNKELNLEHLNWNINNNYVDITTAGIDKGSGAKEMLSHLGHNPDEAVFIFNDYNDLPLINALPTIKKLKVGNLLNDVQAEYTAESPLQVAKVLNNLL